MYFDYIPPPPCTYGCSCCTTSAKQEVGKAGTKSTDVGVKLVEYSQDKTHSGCLSIPLKSGGSLSLEWIRQSSMAPVESGNIDGWMPAGAGGGFSFLPRVNLNSLPSPSGRRVFAAEGTLAYDDSDNPQAELPVKGFRDTTYFTVYHTIEGAYFEYFAGTGIQASADPNLFGRLNRRYDTRGNELKYLGTWRGISGSISTTTTRRCRRR